MVVSPELATLVALLRYGSYRREQMSLRQRLIEGESPAEILADEPNPQELLQKAHDDIDQWITAGEQPISWCDEEYPQQLREVHDFPPVIFTRGTRVPYDHGLCVVGSRNAGPRAINAARDLARIIVDKGWTVVSGLAKGVDTAAHREALECGGRTVAVIGNGIDLYYPAQNRALQETIENRGLVVSQFWPGSSPTRYSFPMRNAVMSAYGSATIIVEASESSGTRHQARQAAAHSRPLVVSRSVYEGTTWARKLVDSPHVLAAVATSAVEAVDKAIGMVEFTFSPPALAALL
ncbi:DNA-processing protein DprA [Trueperella sp. LYQ141]|uniref:DNA-processing protein DprA n=1 Tax=Trueperella sp. LYQ141 TaxID=3391058 RepID=UPI00398314A3